MKAVIKYNVGTERQTKNGKYFRQVVVDYEKKGKVNTVVATLWSDVSMLDAKNCEVWFDAKTKTWYGRPQLDTSSLSL